MATDVRRDLERIAIVCPRYGPTIGGGAEGLARAIATLLADKYEVSVATTCALDYVTWRDHFPAGLEMDGPVRVHRFPIDHEREQHRFDEASQRAYADVGSSELAEEWMRAQGPLSSELNTWLRQNAAIFKSVIFIPYLYATTTAIRDLDVPTILVPCLHDEPPLRLSIFDSILRAASALSFNAPEEQELAERRFAHLPEVRRVISGPLATPRLGNGAAFRAALALADRPYVLCVGRIEEAKGTPWLADRLPEWRVRHPELDLVLVGHEHHHVNRRDGLVITGFVDEDMKLNAIAGATAVVLPSPFESLSIAALEAWLQARPTLANAASPVLVGQSNRSGGGLWYSNTAEFHSLLDFLVDYPMVGNVLGAQGRRWAGAETSPEHIRDQWISLIETVSESARRA
jgi:glycosyltransferase involved in cell wall biosynthesis